MDLARPIDWLTFAALAVLVGAVVLCFLVRGAVPPELKDIVLVLGGAGARSGWAVVNEYRHGRRQSRR